MKSNYSYLVLGLNISDQQTKFCLTRLYMTLKITKGKSIRVKKLVSFFSFVTKKVQEFSIDRKILISLLSVPFYPQNRLSFLKFKFLTKILGEMLILSLNSTSFNKELW